MRDGEDFWRRWPLNPEQRRAVLTVEGPVLILAGAGTGKTRVITARIAHLLASGQPADGLLAVTFTNKAAEEMRQRVASSVDRAAAEAVTICTFHSLALRLLRADIDRLGYKRNFTIYDESDQLGVIRKLIGRAGQTDRRPDPKLVQTLIGRAKNRGLDPSAASSDEPMGDLFRRYSTELKAHNAVDFDDLLLLAVRLLRGNDDVRERWRARFRHVMVDEFQDTNRLQLDLLRMLVGDPPNVCVVGDDDQSIYAWRGAEISNILEFERHFPSPTVIKLEQNYRSTTSILDLANSVIRNNPRRRPKRLWSEAGEGERVRIAPFADEREEAAFVATEIQSRRAGDGARWEDFAILYRTNAQSRLFEENLRQLAIPYRVVGGRSFFDRREVKDILAYLSTLLNPDDDISLLRILNNPPRGIGETTAEVALRESQRARTSLYRILSSSAFLSQIGTRPAAAVREFFAFLERHRSALAEPGADYPAITRRVIADTRYMEHLRSCCTTPAEADSRRENIEEFLNWMGEHHRDGRGDARAFLDSATLDRARDERDPETNRRGVTLITLHAAKGLEFPHVYLVGIEEGLLPHSRSLLENTLDEERRLFYVGITRAMRTLMISHADSRTRHGQNLPSRRSKFLDELPSERIAPMSRRDLVPRPLAADDRKRNYAEIRRMLESKRPGR